MHRAAVSHGSLPMSQNHRMRRYKDLCWLTVQGQGSKVIYQCCPCKQNGTVMQAAGRQGQVPETQTIRVSELISCSVIHCGPRERHFSHRSAAPSVPALLTGAPPHTPFSGGDLQHDCGWGNTLKPSSRHVSLELKLRCGGGNGEKFYVIFAIVLLIRSC